MASKKSKGEQKISKQFILDHLDEKEIDLSMCNLSQVPVKELASVTRGTRLDLSRNLFTALPDNFGTLKHLIELDLSSNQLTLLPDSISQLVILQKLDLYSNKLTTLPLTFWELKKLKWLDLRNNDHLEPGLAEAAGPCVSEAECKQCASKVLIFMKQKSADHERRRQLELQHKREKEKRLEELEKQRRDEERKEKAELRQRKREEHAKMEEERRAAEKLNEEQEQHEEFVKMEKKVNNQASGTKGCSCVTILCLTLVSVVMLLLLLLVGSYVYCDYLKSPNHLCSYWRTYAWGEETREEWTEQLKNFIGLS